MKQLETWQALESFVINDNKIHNGVGWYYNDKALVYYNTGYEAVFTIPDWEKLRLDILEHYTWIETESDLLEAYSDAVSNYKLFSRG